METKIKYTVLLLILFWGCGSKEIPYSKKIVGEWYGVTDWANLVIQFAPDRFIYDEKINNTKFECRYKIKNDTLFLFRDDSVDRHIIFIGNENILKFTSLNSKEKDASFIDGLAFRKKR